MAYSIKCDGYPLLDVRDEELILLNPQFTLEVNTVGGGSFTIYNNHPYYDKLLKKKSIIELSDEFGVIFRGRTTNDTVDFDNGKAVDLEGAMAFFNDSIIRPFAFPDDFLTDAAYIAAAENGNVIEFFIAWLIDQHNAQVQPFQRLKLGNVTVTDPNNYLSRSSTGYARTWETLKNKLFESSLGGKLCIRYEDDGNYIDYLAKFELDNTQDIVFGENMLDLSNTSDATATYSAIIPLGAEIESDAETEDGTKVKYTVNIKDLPDGNVTDDIVKQGDTLYSKSAVEAFGWVYAPTSETTWGDVTEARNLQTKGAEWLSGKGVKLSNTIEVVAVDLHFTDKEIRSFRIYRNIRVHSTPHGLSDVYELTKLDLDIMNPQNTKIAAGETTLTLIDHNNRDSAETEGRIESVKQDIEESRNEILNETNSMIVEQGTSIVDTCEEIIFSAFEMFVEQSKYDSFKQTVESQLSILADEINLRFTKTTKQINNVDGDLQKKFNVITKFFTFEVDGLTIGQVDNPYKIVIDNDRFSMFVNNVEFLWIDAVTQEVHTPDLDVTNRFKMLGYLIEEDANGNVNCEYIGG